MFDLGVEAACAAVLILFSIPILAIRSILAPFETNGPAVCRRILRNCGFIRSQPSGLRSAGEFRFDRAIEAYEELIDSTLAKRQV
jgi:hypothetical protein